MKHYQMYIDGEWVDAGDGARLESINPASGEVWATAAIAGIPRSTVQCCGRSAP